MHPNPCSASVFSPASMLGLLSSKPDSDQSRVMNEAQNIVIVGGGSAGTTLAGALERRLPASHHDRPSEITPPDQYLSRRQWLQLALAGSVAGLGGMLAACAPKADAPNATLGLRKLAGAKSPFQALVPNPG